MDRLNQLFEEAYKLFESKDYEAALKKAEKIKDSLSEIENLPGESLNEIRCSLYNFEGFVLLSLSKQEEARACFERSLEINPNSSQACAGLGEVFYLLKMDQESKIMFEWAIDANPLNQVATNGLSKVNSILGLPSNHSTLNIETMISKKESFISTITKAYKAFSEKNFEKSLEKLEEAEDLFSPGFSGAENVWKACSIENFKGFNLLALNRKEEARMHFEKALSLNNESSQACAGLGECFFLDGKDRDSKTMFEWAQKNNPANEFARAGLAKVNLNLGLSETDNSLSN